MLAFLFIDSPREYLLATVFLIVLGFLALVLICLRAVRAYKETTAPGKRYPAFEAPRFQLPREPHIDLKAVREEHERWREKHDEDVQLRRAG